MEYSPDLKHNFATAYLAGEYERLARELADGQEAASGDTELLRIAEDDAMRIRARQADILADIERILDKEKETVEMPSSVVLELRAGAGGDEAALFARDLMTMYQVYATSRGWKTRIVDDLTLEIASP